jgi:hypothetical protein
MGGQACVFYGAAEFSRDCDVVILANSENLERLQSALKELDAHCIAIPPFEQKYLESGHAVHFRCMHPDAPNMRLDVMTKLRGVDDFELLWERRLTLEDSTGATFDILGIEDLVKAKKTQRDKDWPMIRRLLDSHYDEFRTQPTEDRVRFWLRESRTPEVLIAIAAGYPVLVREVMKIRPLLVETLSASRTALRQELAKEEAAEKLADEQYWRPLKRELESIRMNRRKKP